MTLIRFQCFYFGVLTFIGFVVLNLFVYYSKHQVSNASESQKQDNKTRIYPWMGDPDCQHFPVQFAKNKTRPKWALTSFPGSGVTWTRQLIEGVTGIYTGTVYGSKEPPIVSTGYHGNEADLNCDCTILIKDHDGTEVHTLYLYLEVTGNISMNEVAREQKYQHRGILLLRNPIDALFSFVHYLMAGQDQIGTVSPVNFKGPVWNNFVNYVTYAWADHAIRWIQNIRNGTVIFYELLLTDTVTELNRLLRAINFTDPQHPPVDPDRMRCTLKHKDRLDRKRLKKPTIPLTFKQHTKLKASVERVQESLRQKGWPLLPLHLYNLQKQKQF